MNHNESFDANTHETASEIRQTIGNELRQIEERENVRILYAAESGSRAWGFASPDSDYDVRFIYMRPKNEYLRLKPHRDVIELPIDDVLDINGWDLPKTLRLLYKNNPSLFEWVNSPIVYRSTEFAGRLCTLMQDYFFPRSNMQHYYSMAFNNYARKSTDETLKPKKYFYVLRPLLACRYVYEHGKPAPISFRELLECELPDALNPAVERLLELKMNTPEDFLIPRVPELDAWISCELEALKSRIQEMPAKHIPDWKPLDSFFLQELECWRPIYAGSSSARAFDQLPDKAF